MQHVRMPLKTMTAILTEAGPEILAKRLLYMDRPRRIVMHCFASIGQLLGL